MSLFVNVKFLLYHLYSSHTGQIGVKGGCKGASEEREMMTTTKMNVTLKQEGERGYFRREVFVIWIWFLFRL